MSTNNPTPPVTRVPGKTSAKDVAFALLVRIERLSEPVLQREALLHAIRAATVLRIGPPLTGSTDPWASELCRLLSEAFDERFTDKHPNPNPSEEKPSGPANE